MALICGHRGFGSGSRNGLSENSPESVHAAVEHGVDWVEIDARLTRDGALVSHHNPELPDGRLIRDCTLMECLTAGIHEVSELLIAAEKVPVNIDVKTSTADATASWEYSTGGRLARLLTEYKHPNDVLVTSFDPSIPVRMRFTVPGIKVGLLGWPTFPIRKLIPAAAHLQMDAISFDYSSTRENAIDPASSIEMVFIDEEFEKCQDLGIQTMCYNIPTSAVGHLFLEGLDVATVDDVPSAIAARDLLQGAGPRFVARNR